MAQLCTQVDQRCTWLDTDIYDWCGVIVESGSSFGTRLRQLRDACGLSQLKLAGLVNYHQSLISKVETGAEQPSAAFARAVDEALGAKGELTALVPSPALTPDDNERLLLAARRPSRTDLGVIESLDAVLAAHRRLDDIVGARPLLRSVSAQLVLVEDLVTEARGPIRPRLVSVAAQWAQFGGWLHTSAGRADTARRWFSTALEWAEEINDREMVAAVLSFRGHTAWLEGRVGASISLSQAARRDTTVFDGERAYDALQEARGHALTGDRQSVERLCGISDELAASERSGVEFAPPWYYYGSAAFFELERGLVYRFLGRSIPQYNQQAVDLIRSGLAGLPPEQRSAEWAGEYLYHQAAAHLQDGDRASALDAIQHLERIAATTRAKPLMEKAGMLRRHANS